MFGSDYKHNLNCLRPVRPTMIDLEKKYDRINMNDQDLVQKKWEEYQQFRDEKKLDGIDTLGYLRKYIKEMGRGATILTNEWNNSKLAERISGVASEIQDNKDEIENANREYHEYKDFVQLVHSRVVYGRNGIESRVRNFIRSNVKDKKLLKQLLKKIDDELF